LEPAQREDIEKFCAKVYQGPFLVDILENIHPHVIEKVKLLAAIRPVFVVSSRNRHVFQKTIEVLREKMPFVTGFAYAAYNEGKSLQCSGLNLGVYVEDQLGFASEIAHHSTTHVLLVTKHYNVLKMNEEHRRITPVDSIGDAYRFIVEMWRKGMF
jgi:uncharacterized HAD superfamily protein